MNVFKSSLMGDESEEDLRSGFQAILDLFIDAAINMCLSVSDARQNQKPDWDSDIFLLNCITHLIVSLLCTQYQRHLDYLTDKFNF